MEYMAPQRPRVFSNINGCVLRVFADNTAARKLYDSMGFRQSSTHRMQNLPQLRMVRMDAEEFGDEKAADSCIDSDQRPRVQDID